VLGRDRGGGLRLCGLDSGLLSLRDVCTAILQVIRTVLLPHEDAYLAVIDTLVLPSGIIGQLLDNLYVSPPFQQTPLTFMAVLMLRK